MGYGRGKNDGKKSNVSIEEDERQCYKLRGMIMHDYSVIAVLFFNFTYNFLLHRKNVNQLYRAMKTNICCNRNELYF